jgi:hypothetical protein
MFSCVFAVVRRESNCFPTPTGRTTADTPLNIALMHAIGEELECPSPLSYVRKKRVKKNKGWLADFGHQDILYYDDRDCSDLQPII